MVDLRRDDDSRKGDNGKVAILAGSKDFAGAPALAGKAALRTGADLVRIMTSESVKDVVAGFSEDLIVESYHGDYFDQNSFSRAEKLRDWSDIMVLGPGLGKPELKPLQKLVDNKKCVIDADAINSEVFKADISSTVITPHQEEAEILGDIETFVEENECLVALKGPKDRIYSVSERFELGFGTSAMTCGGTGDVLAGVIGGLWSQGLDRLDATRIGLEVNGRAGKLAKKKYGSGLVASDLLDRIPEGLESAVNDRYKSF